MAMHREDRIDLHGMSVSEAWVELDYFLDYLEDDVDEITVVHGYKQGSALLEMVRKSYQHPRVVKKILSMNNGITIFLLRPGQ